MFSPEPFKVRTDRQLLALVFRHGRGWFDPSKQLRRWARVRRPARSSSPRPRSMIWWTDNILAHSSDGTSSRRSLWRRHAGRPRPSLTACAHCPLLCRFSAAGTTAYPRGKTAGGRKAPRQEIAGGVWRRCCGRYGDFAAGWGLLRLDRCGRRARFSSKGRGLRGWKRVERAKGDPIEAALVQSREMMRVPSLPAANQQV